MAFQFFRGSQGSVKFGSRGAGVSQPLSEWTLTTTAAEIDQSDYNSLTKKFALDLPQATIAASGPYPQIPLDLKLGDTALMTLWLDESQGAGFSFSTLITGLTLSSSARGVPQFSLTAVVNEDFYTGTATTPEVIL